MALYDDGLSLLDATSCVKKDLTPPRAGVSIRLCIYCCTRAFRAVEQMTSHCFRLVCLSVVTLTQSLLIGFLPNFMYELLPSIFHSSSNMGFVRHPITKMADKMAATYQYPLSWSL